jgi:peptidyl-prolyl cis-trans isomerase C
MDSSSIRSIRGLAALFFMIGGSVVFGGQEGTPSQTAMATARPESFPDIVARVNGAVIHKNELVRRVEAMRERVGLPEGDLPLEIYRTVLSDLVDIELLYQASQSRRFEASAEEVDEEVQDLRSQFPSEEAFQSQLALEEMTADQLREILKKDLSVQKLVEEDLLPKVFITAQEKRRFYDENLEVMQRPEELRLRHILVRVDEGASPEERSRAREKLELLRKQVVEEGADFAALARQFSDDTGSRDNGGELVVARGQTVEAFEQAAFNLEPGAISDIVGTPFGYHIILLTERIPGGQVAFEDAEGQIQQYLQRELLHRAVGGEVEILRSEASINLYI